MTPPLAVTVREAARLLGVSRATVFRLLESGALRRVQITPGRRGARVCMASLEAHCAPRPVRSPRRRHAAFVPVDLHGVLRVVQG